MRTLTCLLRFALALPAAHASQAPATAPSILADADVGPPSADVLDLDAVHADQTSVSADTARAADDSAPTGAPASPLVMLALALGLYAFGTIRQGESVDGGTLYRPAFQTMVDGVPKRIDPSSFKDTDWVDAYGVLKPGTPLAADGTLADGAIVEDVMTAPAVFVVPYAVGIASGNTDALLDAAPNGDIAVATRGDIIKSHVEAALGRSLTADEIAAYGASGRFVIL